MCVDIKFTIAVNQVINMDIKEPMHVIVFRTSKDCATSHYQMKNDILVHYQVLLSNPVTIIITLNTLINENNIP